VPVTACSRPPHCVSTGIADSIKAVWGLKTLLLITLQVDPQQQIPRRPADPKKAMGANRGLHFQMLVVKLKRGH
jgi:hypothetical protein